LLVSFHVLPTSSSGLHGQLFFLAPFGGSWFWPLLGIIFLPFTTLMYVLLWSPGIGLVGFDWFWLILAVFLDISHWGATAYSNRDRMPGYVPA
jgi:hypothetical protein